MHLSKLDDLRPFITLVGPGDCAVIAPGDVHQLVNIGAGPLVLLCCCAPAYSDGDTVLVDGAS